MELSDIDARIAQLKEQIALKEAAQKQIKESYQNPYSKYHYGYIFDAVAGDRSGLDKEAAEEAAYQKMLMEQAQADKIRAEQAYNTAYENELNRVNAREIASVGKEAQAAYDRKRTLDNKELELDLLKAKREEVARVGGNTKEYDLKINSIYKQFPELGTATVVEETPWDPTKSQSYLLAAYGDYDDSYTQDELNEAIGQLQKYATTDEGAKRLAQLNKSLKKRQKYDTNAAQIKADLDAYARTGVLSDLLVDLGWSVEGSVNNRYAQRNGKGNKTYFKGKGKGKKSKPVLK